MQSVREEEDEETEGRSRELFFVNERKEERVDVKLIILKQSQSSLALMKLYRSTVKLF